MSNGEMGQAEKRAVENTALHNNTPTTSIVDAMGNEFLSIKDNGDEDLWSYRVFDVKVQPRETRDARGRLILRTSYDMVGNGIMEETMDTSAS